MQPAERTRDAPHLGNCLLIALGGSAITALVALVGSNTTLKVARLQTEQARRETWETKRLEPARLS
jgi:hypothetical protein